MSQSDSQLRRLDLASAEARLHFFIGWYDGPLAGACTLGKPELELAFRVIGNAMVDGTDVRIALAWPLPRHTIGNILARSASTGSGVASRELLPSELNVDERRCFSPVPEHVEHVVASQEGLTVKAVWTSDTPVSSHAAIAHLNGRPLHAGAITLLDEMFRSGSDEFY